MRFAAAVVTVWLAAGGVHAQQSLDAILERFNAARKTAPADIGVYMDRAEACWHFAGEEGYDAARRAEIGRALRELRCAGLKNDEARLRRRYARSPEALAAIDAAAALQ